MVESEQKHHHITLFLTIPGETVYDAIETVVTGVLAAWGKGVIDGIDPGPQQGRPDFDRMEKIQVLMKTTLEADDERSSFVGYVGGLNTDDPVGVVITDKGLQTFEGMASGEDGYDTLDDIPPVS